MKCTKVRVLPFHVDLSNTAKDWVIILLAKLPETTRKNVIHQAWHLMNDAELMCLRRHAFLQSISMPSSKGEDELWMQASRHTQQCL
jgi:hypothetical protein